MLAFERAVNGSLTVRLDGRLLHSGRDPEREAQRVCAEIARRDPPCVVLLGLGLGYHAEHLLRNSATTRLLVYEPVEELIRHARQRMAGELDAERVTIVTDPAALESALPKLCSQSLQVLVLPGREAAQPELFATARAAVDRHSSRLSINQNTLRRFSRLWVRNLCRNLTAVCEGSPVSALRGAFGGLPGLLLAAGPGLDQVLEVLPRLAQRLVLVAVDTAIAPCLRCGVEPDFAVVVDPQYWNARHLDRQLLRTSVLVCEPSVHPSVFRSFTSPPVFCSSLFPLGRSYESVTGTLGTLGAGGSVATTAWDLMRSMGIAPVFAAGLDLGFPAGRTHCRDSYFERLAVLAGRRVRPAEGVVFRYTYGADAHPVPSTDGRTVLSDRRMDLYRGWFASQLAAPGAPPTRHISTGGAVVPGMESATLEEALALPPARSRIRPLRMQALESARRPVGELRAAINTHTGELVRELEDLRKLALTALGVVRGARENAAAGRPPRLDELQSLDDLIAANRSGPIGGFLIQESLDRIADGYGSASVAEQLDASEQLYAGLAEAAAFHAACLVAARVPDRQGTQVLRPAGRE